MQVLSSAKGYVNDWLTVTNSVPPVNDSQGHGQVTEDGEPEVILGHITPGKCLLPEKRKYWITQKSHGALILGSVPSSEKSLIAKIRTLALSKTKGSRKRAFRSGIRVGIGDDCAVLRTKPGHELLVTTDFSLEGVHFRRDWHPAESVGHRCLARGLSDIAAMGGEPLAAFLSLAVPRDLPQAWLNRFFRGFLRLANRYGVTLAGGDTAESPAGILADIVVVGQTPRGKAVLRSGARPGDRIVVSGELGGSAAAVEASSQFSDPSSRFSVLSSQSRRGGRAGIAEKTRVNARDFPRHFYPEPRAELGRRLREKGWATAMIDTSDGLSTDLAHICEESGVGAEISSELIPRARVGKPASLVDLELALHGGEDYELLFTVPPGRVPSRIAGVPLTQIGVITRAHAPVVQMRDGEGVLQRLAPHGWEHFQR